MVVGGDRNDVRRRRAVAQRLHRPPVSGVGELVRGLLAVQAQDVRAYPHALRARATGLAMADLDAARERGEVVVTWLMRGTLHLVNAEDAAWLHALTAGRQATSGERRLRQLGVAEVADRAVEVVDEALADGAPHTRAELTERLAGIGVPAQGQAAIHLLGLAARRQVCVLGPAVGGEPAYVSWRAWLGDADVPVDDPHAELARRYLAAHGPATDADLATWSGLPLRDVRAGLRAIGDELVSEPDGLLALRGPMPDESPPLPARLLPAFDPYLLGWHDRTFAVDPAHATKVAPGGGVVKASAAVDGRLVATWRTSRQSGALRVTLEPFEPLDGDVEAALGEDAAEAGRFES
ncbi:MAG: winged helix DNA-binding domain-containing protein [Streptosporangiales bacterium]|nr:winged helix DNA-binding domain-containing protein [Streptosporangiales bacterium]